MDKKENNQPTLVEGDSPPCVPTPSGSLKVLKHLATGGMAEVLLVERERSRGFRKRMVLKKLLPALLERTDNNYHHMMLDEARIGALFHHPNLCEVLDVWEEDDQVALLMNYVEGITFLDLINRRLVDQRLADLRLHVALAIQTCEGLQYAHELRDENGVRLDVIHRDVTPSNLMLTYEGIVKVMDFGVAKNLIASTKTQPGTRKGKWAYMAPEQMNGGTIDSGVDVFSTAVVLWEMICGRHLFRKESDFLTMRAVLEEKVPDIQKYNTSVSDELADVIHKALHKDRASRWPTAAEFAKRLHKAVLPLGGPTTRIEIEELLTICFAQQESMAETAVVHIDNLVDPRARPKFTKDGTSIKRVTNPTVNNPRNPANINDPSTACGRPKTEKPNATQRASKRPITVSPDIEVKHNVRLPTDNDAVEIRSRLPSFGQ